MVQCFNIMDLKEWLSVKNMQKFYNREDELSALRQVTANITRTKGQLSVVVGKRRVGKTRLLKEAFFRSEEGAEQRTTHQAKALYLFVSRKSEVMLVSEFATLIELELGAKFFRPTSLKEVLEFLLDYATTQPLTLIIDEFQDIQRVQPSLFSDIQNLWDAYKQTTMMHLVCCGSMFNMMTKIFKEQDEPLLNRDDRFFKINALKPSTIKQIMHDCGVFSPKRMLEWWCLSGGVPKYLEWLSLASNNESVFDAVISASSPFIKEGAHRLVEDFGAEHQSQFDILAAISTGHTTRSQIKNFSSKANDFHLDRLERHFNVIRKVNPVSSGKMARDARFEIEDPFLKFWFKFIHSNSSAVEMGNYAYIKAHIERDFSTFSGWELESLFKAILAESQQFSQIGSYWNNKGTDEIDIVAINPLEKRVLIAEVKRQQAKYNPNILIAKAQPLLARMNLHRHEITYRGFSLDNLEDVMTEFGL